MFDKFFGRFRINKDGKEVSLTDAVPREQRQNDAPVHLTLDDAPSGLTPGGSWRERTTGLVPNEAQRQRANEVAQKMVDEGKAKWVSDPKVADTTAFLGRARSGTINAPRVRKPAPKHTEPVVVDPSDMSAITSAMKRR